MALDGRGLAAALAWESDEAERVVQTVLKPDGATAWRWEVFSRAAEERSSAAWRRHAEGRLAHGEGRRRRRWILRR